MCIQAARPRRRLPDRAQPARRAQARSRAAPTLDWHPPPVQQEICWKTMSGRRVSLRVSRGQSKGKGNAHTSTDLDEREPRGAEALSGRDDSQKLAKFDTTALYNAGKERVRSAGAA
jgi:hypothetical protein